jgi:hypothetical protein
LVVFTASASWRVRLAAGGCRGADVRPEADPPIAIDGPITYIRPRTQGRRPIRMTFRQISSFDEKVLQLLSDTWSTLGEVRRRLGSGDSLSVAQALERLSEAGCIEKEVAYTIVAPARKGAGSELRFLKFRRKREAARR